MAATMTTVATPQMDNGVAPPRIQALIVDDEPVAREKIRRMLGAETDVEIIGECGNGAEALAAIRQCAPDLVFMDIQMPEMNGFEVLRAMEPAAVPAVIFVTAYDQYALRAFEVHALDYLLKPFSRDRFHRAVSHAREQIAHQRGAVALDNRLLSLLQDMRGGPRFAARLLVRTAGRVYFLKTEEIDWIEAAGNYACLHAGGETHLLRETMKRLENRLDPERFPRIHRSTLVNIDRIREIQPLFNGDYTVILRNGAQLTLSRNYRERLLDLFEQPR
ncbi:MAG: LytR/AlgR family response regulator transcription factor [Blastocatellia bacterium]